MNTEKLQKRLEKTYGCLACLKTRTATRRHQIDEDILVTGIDPFLIDAEIKISSSKAVRRLLDKTQVITDPHNFHIRKRITHCGEVAAIASFIAATLGLNIELARAIARGHDIGHPPFGHEGEKFLNDNNARKHTFNHETFGVVIARHIERNGSGLNLTKEVLCGIMRNKWPKKIRRALSEEAKAVMWADRFAYVTGDYNDFARISYPVSQELSAMMEQLGNGQRERVYTLITALCEESAEKEKVSFAYSDTAKLFNRIKACMYKIYPFLHPSNSKSILKRIFEFAKKKLPDIDPVLTVALMTDADALFLAGKPILHYPDLAQTTVAELLPLLRKREIRWWEPDLEW